MQTDGEAPGGPDLHAAADELRLPPHQGGLSAKTIAICVGSTDSRNLLKKDLAGEYHVRGGAWDCVEHVPSYDRLSSFVDDLVQRCVTLADG